MKTMRAGSRQGISRPEILFLLSVVLGVLSIAVPALMDLGQRRQSVVVFGDMRILVSAANRYNSEYRLWPVADPPARGDARYGSRKSNASVMRILRGIEGEGNEQNRANPSGINFIAEASEGRKGLVLDGQGQVVDPWGQPYEMVFDSNYDSICTSDDAVNAPVVGEGVIVWSSGPDRKPDTRDDLRSWKR